VAADVVKRSHNLVLAQDHKEAEASYLVNNVVTRCFETATMADTHPALRGEIEYVCMEWNGMEYSTYLAKNCSSFGLEPFSV
jgi:hypothetical protein